MDLTPPSPQIFLWNILGGGRGPLSQIKNYCLTVQHFKTLALCSLLNLHVPVKVRPPGHTTSVHWLTHQWSISLKVHQLLSAAWISAQTVVASDENMLGDPGSPPLSNIHGKHGTDHSSVLVVCHLQQSEVLSKATDFCFCNLLLIINWYTTNCIQILKINAKNPLVTSIDKRNRQRSW